MVRCIIPGCKPKNTISKISFHAIPSNEKSRNEWTDVIVQQYDKRGLGGIIDQNSMVCSRHFRAEDYKPTFKSRKLKPSAVPSIFPVIEEDQASTKFFLRLQTLNPAPVIGKAGASDDINPLSVNQNSSTFVLLSKGKDYKPIKRRRLKLSEMLSTVNEKDQSSKKFPQSLQALKPAPPVGRVGSSDDTNLQSLNQISLDCGLDSKAKDCKRVIKRRRLKPSAVPSISSVKKKDQPSRIFSRRLRTLKPAPSTGTTGIPDDTSLQPLNQNSSDCGLHSKAKDCKRVIKRKRLKPSAVPSISSVKKRDQRSRIFLQRLRTLKPAPPIGTAGSSDDTNLQSLNQNSSASSLHSKAKGCKSVTKSSRLKPSAVPFISPINEKDQLSKKLSERLQNFKPDPSIEMAGSSDDANLQSLETVPSFSEDLKSDTKDIKHEEPQSSMKKDELQNKDTAPNILNLQFLCLYSLHLLPIATITKATNTINKK